jgi:hypothetical protein
VTRAAQSWNLTRRPVDADAAADNRLLRDVEAYGFMLVARRCLNNCAWRTRITSAQLFTASTGPAATPEKIRIDPDRKS